MMNYNKLSIVCRNDDWLLHTMFFCEGYYILFWSLQKLQRGLYNLSVISGLCTVRKLITALALDSSTKVKVKPCITVQSLLQCHNDFLIKWWAR